MNWKYEAAAKLKEYPLRLASIEHIDAELRRLEAEFDRIRSSVSDGTPVKGSGAPSRDDAIINNIVLRGELENCLEDAKEWCRIYSSAWDMLEDEERHILDRMYVHRMKGNVERLRDELGLEDVRSVYRRKDKALERFTLLLYGKL